MMSLEPQFRRLEELCGDDGESQKTEFEKFQSIRKTIQERNELLRSNPGAAVKLSAQIRQQIASFEGKNDDKKNDDKKVYILCVFVLFLLLPLLMVDDFRTRAIAELKELDQQRFHSSSSSSSTGQSPFAQVRITRVDQNDIQVDEPQVEKQLQEIRKRDNELDGDLDIISKGAKRLKVIAQDLQSEIKVQTEMVDMTNEKVDATTKHITGKMNQSIKLNQINQS